MKTLCVLLGALVLCLTHAVAQVAVASQQAEMLRSTTGRGQDASGFGNISTPLKKGMIYDVVSQSVGNVVLSVDGVKVTVPSGDVRVSKKEKAYSSAPGAPKDFVPGQIVILSAKYTIAGNQPRNVKNRVQKLIPPGVISKPMEILASDSLSAAAQGQGDGGLSAAVVMTPELFLIMMQDTTVPRNILTIEYSYNGQRYIKQAIEGTKLVLP